MRWIQKNNLVSFETYVHLAEKIYFEKNFQKKTIFKGNALNLVFNNNSENYPTMTQASPA